MALPTISNNSPGAGSISWTAFGIQYNGQSFAIPAGSSSKKFVWWLYGGGTAPSLVDGDTVPNLGPDDMILFLNKGGVGVLVPTAELTDGSLIVSGSILASAIAANEIQTYHLAANSVTANQIAANSVASQDIQAGAITTDKLAVGTVSDSLVTNGSFEEFDATGMPLGWRSIAQTSGSLAIVTGVASSGVNALRLQTTVAASNNVRIEQTPEKFIPVSATAGRKWYVSMRYGAGTATTNGAYLRATFYDANKTTVLGTADVLANGALPTAWTITEGQVTPPASAKYMGISILLVNSNVATSMYVDEIVAREVVVSAIIADGAITTPKMTANTILGDRIQAGTLTATQLAANTITADKLLISDFSNYALGGGFDSANDLLNYGAGTGISVITTDSYSGAGCLQATAQPAQRAAALKNYPPVTAGDQYYIRYYCKTTSDYNGTAGNGKLRFGTQTGALITAYTHPLSTVWQKVEGIVTMPAGTTALQLSISFDHTVGTCWIDELQVRRMNGGELIVDGTITAAEIATDAVTAVKIQANAVVAGKIAANAVVANSIASNSVLSNHILANNILASHIVANAIQANHIQAGAIDGQVITGGELRTTQGAGQIAARMGPSTTFDPTANVVRPGIGFTVAGNTDNPAGMFSPSGTDLKLTQGGPGVTGNQAYLTLGNNNADLYAWQQANIIARSSVTIQSQLGTTVIKGNQVDLQHANGLLVNGKDLSAGEVQVWDFAGNIANNQIPVVKLGGFTDNANLSTSTAVGTVDAYPGIKVTNAGVYDIMASYGESGGFGSPDSRNFLEIGVTSGNNSDKLVARAAFSYQEDSVSVTATGIKLAAGEIVKLEALQNSGGTRTYAGRLRIKRVAAPVPVTAWGSGDQAITGNITAGGKITASGIVSGKIRHWEGYNSSFAVAGNAQWDSGPVTYDSANSTDSAMCTPHSVPGAVMINETGWYQASLYLTPASNPGNGHLHLNYVSGSSGNLITRFATVANGPTTFETFVTTVPILLTAGNYLRSELLYQYDHNVYSRWRIHKVDN